MKDDVDNRDKAKDGPRVDDLQKLWACEVIRRRDEVRSGAVLVIPGELVLAEARRMVGR